MQTVQNVSEDSMQTIDIVDSETLEDNEKLPEGSVSDYGFPDASSEKSEEVQRNLSNSGFSETEESIIISEIEVIAAVEGIEILPGEGEVLTEDFSAQNLRNQLTIGTMKCNQAFLRCRIDENYIILGLEPVTLQNCPTHSLHGTDSHAKALSIVHSELKCGGLQMMDVLSITSHLAPTGWSHEAGSESK